jgi:hypothetical protein
MEKIFCTMTTLVLLATSALAGERFAATAWRHVRTYDVPTLLKQEASLVGKVVAIKFHYRSEKLRHLQPNWYEASIWQHDPNAKNGYSALRIVVEKKDVPDFKTITADFNSMAEVKVYGRIETNLENNLTHVRLLGRKVATDASGNATVSW